MSNNLQWWRRALMSWASIVTLAPFAPMPAYAQSAATSYTVGHRFDILQREVGTISPDPDGAGALKFAAIRYNYDAAGRLWKVEKGELASWEAETVAPADWTGFTVFQTVTATFDGMDRKLSEKVQGSDGGVIGLTQYSYDAFGRPECTAVRMNPAVFAAPPASACTLGTQGSQGPDRITRNLYDAAGQLIQVRKAVGTPLEEAYTTYSYTPNGKQEFVIDAVGNRAKLEYDGFDRQLKWIFPSTTLATAFDGSSQTAALNSAGSVNANDFEAYEYDANGNRISLTKRGGQRITYTYDALNRVTSKVVPTRSDLPLGSTRNVFYGYDLQGRQLYARFDNANGEGITNTFDGFGRLTSASNNMDGLTRTVTYQYDANGNRTRVTFPDGSYASYSYDGLDRPGLIQRGGTSTSNATNYCTSAPFNGLLARYCYGANGARTKFDSGATAGVSTSYSYDAAGRLASLSNNLAANPSYNLTIGGKDGGTCTDTAGAKAVCYNPAGQITEMRKSNSAFIFSAAYNINRDYTDGGLHPPNGLNQYYSAGSARFSYDANGNLTEDGSTSFRYDNENRLVSASGLKNAALRYDPLGRLYEVTSGSATTRFLIAGDELMAEYDGSGNLLRRYVHGADIAADDPVAWYEGSGFDGSIERVLRSDWQGSIVLAADNVGSKVYAANRYDEYGIPQAGNAGRFQYTGQVWLAELGMNYYKARMYSPTLGRFMQTDPIGYKDQINLYAYVANDPVNGTDFTGNESASITCMYAACMPRTPPPPATPIMKLGEMVRGGQVRATIEQNSSTIAKEAKAQNIDGNLVKSLIYEEQTHQTPFESTMENHGLGNTVGLGQVTVGTEGFTRDQLLQPAINIKAMSMLISKISQDQLIDPNRPIASIATRYNCSSCDNITNYGKRVEQYYQSKDYQQ